MTQLWLGNGSRFGWGQLFLWLALGLWTAPGVSASSDRLDAQQTHLLLQGRLSYLKDATQAMTFDEVRSAYQNGQFQSLAGDSVTAGNLFGQAVWVHFTLDLTPHDPTPWWLLVAPEHIDQISLYQEGTDGSYRVRQGGRNQPFVQREFPSPAHAFRLGPLPEGPQQVFLRLTADANIKIEPSLWQEAELIRYLVQVNTGFGAYFSLAGLLWMMALIRVVTFRNSWDVAYLGYLTGFELFHFVNTGLLGAWGITESLAWRNGLISLGVTLTGLGFVALVRTLIVWPDSWIKPLDRVLPWAMGLIVLVLGLARLFQHAQFMEINLLTTVGLLLIATLVALWASWKNYPHARVMTLCFLPFILWVLFLTIIRYLDAVTVDIWVRQRVLMMTSIVHMFALWLLVFNKDARLREEKQALQNELSAVQNEMQNQSLFMSLLTHEMNRPLQRLLRLVRADQEDNVSLRRQLHGLGLEMNGVLETCSDRIQQALSTVIHREPTDIRRLAESIIRHYQQRSPQHIFGADLDALPASFDCDPKLIAILLSNLMENATRHAPIGSTIHVSGHSRGQHGVELRVEDEGPGIPQAALRSIFDRYVQLETQLAQEQKGMGLGLFIVRRIAELHGGNVVCASEPGVGTQFIVHLSDHSA